MSVAPRARTQSTSTGHAREGRPRRWRRTASVATALSLAAAAGFAGASPAVAAEGDESYAAARFLAGTVGGTSLDDLLAIQGVEAHNQGQQESVVEADTLDVSVLGEVEVPLGPTTIPLGDLMQLGAVNQYAEAAPEARSRGAAGAVSSMGAVNTAGSGEFPADATVSLGSLLDQAQLSAVLDDVAIRLRGISAVAALDGAAEGMIASSCAELSDPEHCRDYAIAGGEIVLSAPALADLVTAITGVTAEVDGAVATVDTALGQAVAAVLASELPPALAPLVTVNDLDVSVTTDVSGALSAIAAAPLSGGGVTIDLGTGEITADLEALLGRSLSDLPPNTEILSAEVIAALVAAVADLLETLPAQVGAAVTTALDAAQVRITGDACGLPGVGADCLTGVSLDVDGTLGSLDEADIDVALEVGGTPVPAGDLVAELQTGLAAVGDEVLEGALVTTIVAELNGMLAALLAELAPALEGLTDLVSLLANVQEAGRTEGAYREVAVRVTLGAAAGATGIAQVDLAGVEVGPNLLGTATPAAPTSPTAPGSPTLPNVGAADTLPMTLGGLLMLLGGLVLIRRQRGVLG